MGHAERRATGLLSVTVAYSPRAGVVEEVALAMRAGASVADALRDSGLLQRHGIDAGATAVGVWGALVDAQTPQVSRLKIDANRIRWRNVTSSARTAQIVEAVTRL